ncbi:hypothetical protein MHB50_05070 [Siminovitchia sp. FSL H7-0308]|uniref:Uncharacterized protein n=1 Tax=Siminovitchia thermophila TaxID=1245522 RepID=A0ABS2R529_9BACI|nr:hypothetical protein [Siminovitchia thermophila]MBM7714726.1 hypothetical protein [Siminovitchia thermophila]
MSKKKRKSPLYIGKEYYGDIPIEEAFNTALAPCFNLDNSTEAKEKTSS